VTALAPLDGMKRPKLPAATAVGEAAAAHSGYRADVDGLRAVAIVPVVLFHAGLYRFAGGFVGVDVFFVISGFLITTLIRRDIEDGSFSVYRFYERRVRRIFPSLFAVLLVTTALAAIISPPRVLIDFGKTLASSAAFSSNVFFWSQAGYFDDTMHRNPMLHTWSLSVEEQFYVVFPLILSALLPASIVRTRIVVGVIGIASLALAVWATPREPSFAFYLMPTRAWELLLGAALALGAGPGPIRPSLREGGAALGLLLIVWSVLTYTPSIPFPGSAALAPCVGAALIIHTGSGGPTAVSRVLSWRPLVLIGLISYPLYLWHWPIFVFAKEEFGDQLSYAKIAACVLLSTALATALWLLVETPIRRRIVLPSRRAIFAAGAACLLAAAVGGGLLAGSGGMMWRYPMAARTVLAAEDAGGGELFRTGTCFITPEDPHYKADTCLRVDPNRPNILLLGDSHAAHYWYGLNRVFTGANILQATASGCRPVLGGSVQGKDVCRPLVNSVIRDFLPTHRVDTVILAANWWNDETDLLYLPQTVACLKQYADRVIVVGPIGAYDRPLPELLANNLRAPASLLKGHRIRQMERIDKRMSALAQANGIEYLSVYRMLCPEGRECKSYAAPGMPMQFDRDHLTAAGSVFVAQRWMDDGDILPGGASRRPPAAPAPWLTPP